MKFYFIRHGQSENNQLWALKGSTEGRRVDPELTEIGRQQAERLAAFLDQPGLANPRSRYDTQDLSGFGITNLYCSLMVRAVATGTVVADTLNLPLTAWVDAHESGGIHHRDEDTGEHFGLPGKNREYFQERYPNLVLPQSLGDEGWWNRSFEAPEERPVRARRFVHDLLTRHGGTDDRVAVISHGGFYNHVLRAIFSIPDGQDRWFSINNTGITRIDFGDETVWLSYANRVDFLPRELIT